MQTDADDLPLDAQGREEIRDGMRITFDMPIRMADGLVLRADIFRPVAAGRYAVLMSHGPYGKYLHFEDGYASAWTRMVTDHPDVAAGSTNKYQSWEVADPEKWVPEGYACVRVDSRGAGRSPGFLDIWSPQETADYAACIEWAARQPWSNGKIGLSGISYYAMNQWQVATLAPTGLAAICLWEGAADFYRDAVYHGGILSTFFQDWYSMQVTTVQHGLGTRGKRSRFTGDLVSGPPTLTAEELSGNRADIYKDVFDHHLDDDHWRARSPDWSRVNVPLFSTANWGGQGLHPRGNFEGFVRAASSQKWLEVHGIEHWTHYYTDYGRALQKRFFDHFLKGEDSGWSKEPKVRLQVRHPGERFVERHEADWPIPRTQWTPYHLDPQGGLSPDGAATAPATLTFKSLGDGLTFLTQPMAHATEITGPIAARLHLASSTRDADLFLVLRVFAPDLKEITFQGALDPHTPVAQGWLRASHRKLDPTLSRPYRPYHAHDEVQPLDPGAVYALDIEIWPTCIVVPAGFRLGLSVRGRDYQFAGDAGHLSNMKQPMSGCGPFIHNDGRDRPLDLFGGETTLHFGADRDNFVLLPIIPAV